MNTLVLSLLINHLADIINDLEEKMEQRHELGLFTKIRVSELSEKMTFKEVLPLYGLMQTLQRNLPPQGVDNIGDMAV